MHEVAHLDTKYGFFFDMDCVTFWTGFSFRKIFREALFRWYR